MKVEKIVGWLTGSAGTGNVFELSHNGGYLLAMIWQDGKFHYLGLADLNKQIAAKTAAVQVSAMRSGYLTEFPQNADGSLPVENPDGWKRIFEPTTPGSGDGETVETKEILEIPFKIEGKITIDLGRLGEFLKLID